MKRAPQDVMIIQDQEEAVEIVMVKEQEEIAEIIVIIERAMVLKERSRDYDDEKTGANRMSSKDTMVQRKMTS